MECQDVVYLIYQMCLQLKKKMIFQVSYFPCCREPGKCWLPGPFWVCCCFVSLFPTPMVSFVFQRWLTHVSARIHVLTEQTVSPRDLGRTCSFVLAPPSSFISKNGKRRQSSRGSGYFSHRVNYHTAGENVRLQRWMMRDWQVTSASQVRFTVRILHSWVVTSIWLRCIPFFRIDTLILWPFQYSNSLKWLCHRPDAEWNQVFSKFGAVDVPPSGDFLKTRLWTTF